MATYYRINLRDKENNIVYPNIHNLISIDNKTGAITSPGGFIGLATKASADSDGNKINTTYLKKVGNQTISGTITFTDGEGTSTKEGGEIHLAAKLTEKTLAGTIIDNNNGQTRIFGIPSADGTTKTGPGTPLVIDPYAKTITGGYTITGNINGQLTSSVTTYSYISGNKGINVIINGTAAAGYNVLARQKSTNGVFTLAAFNNSYYLNYTSDTNINNGVNGVNAAVRLLDENGNSAFPGTVNVNKLYGSIELPNNTWNKVGDDVYFGDANQGGCLCLKGANADTGICFFKKDDASQIGHLRYNGNFYFSAPFCGLVHNELGLHLENTTTDKGWSMINSNYNGFILKTIRTQQNAPAWICGDYSSGIAFGGADTHGVISVRYPEPEIKFAGGNSDKPRWYITIQGSSGQRYVLPSIGGRLVNTRDDTTRFFRSGAISTWNSNYSGYENGTIMFCW